MGERRNNYIDSESPFCRNCTRDDCPANGGGCQAWKTYFIDNWNENIMNSTGNNKKRKKQRQFFRYEHPDLERERGLFLNMSKAKMYGYFKPGKNCAPPRWKKIPQGNKCKQKGNVK